MAQLDQFDGCNQGISLDWLVNGSSIIDTTYTKSEVFKGILDLLPKQI
ncbi:hypothetical protein [Gracilibacillus salinarum]|uniref:Uncharacterized protein n=1 Tax=Gracilibacillus salinarum TaxID=2932255 RepID=A0ABY4GMR9_9BACI|nr:hypothetical protein [Gracilibacillus salinarum]UOQ85250.1 hypothetical protein MUN87_21845 [Gracilibacillus salinarum]